MTEHVRENISPPCSVFSNRDAISGFEPKTFPSENKPTYGKRRPCPRRQGRQESFLFFFLLHYSCPPVCLATTGGPLFFAGLRPARAATRRLNCNLENQEKLWDTTCVLRAVLKVLTKKSKPWHKLCLNGDFEKNLKTKGDITHEHS